MSSYSQPQWPGSNWAYAENHDPYSNGYAQFPNYSAYLADSMEAYQNQHHHLVHHHQMSRTTESKPRLSKEEVEILEAEFQKNHKPNSITKKALAESMRVDNARINNWFQNRRAREKKENNIREYEARQKLEKEKSDVDSENSPFKRELVASSAPFPNAQGSATSTDGQQDLDQSSEASGTSASPEIMTQTLKAKSATKINVCPVPNSTDGTVSDDPSPLFSTDDEASDYFDRTNGSYSEYWVSDAPVGYSDGSPAQSPCDQSANDIASRRNRRPPHLALNPARSYSSGLLKAGMDMGRKPDFGSSMRRVVSATGTGRVSKPMAAPRGQGMDRNSGDALNRNRSPVMTVPRVKTAPPTPNTPVVPTQPGKINSAFQAPFEVNEALSTADIAVHDPSFRTPPTTPGVMENVFSFNVHGLPMSESRLVSHGLSGFQPEFEMTSMSMPVPNYIANAPGCSSQPESPSFTSQMGPAYFGYAGGNTEYNWSDDSAPPNPMQGSSAHNVHFMNMTSSSFPITDR